MAQTKRSAAENVDTVDPHLRRPRNADESMPETLVPDVVHTHLQRDESGSAAAAQLAPDRWHRIQRRAYEIARERGFAPGAELNDWLQAEREIDGESAGGARQPSPEDRF